MAHKQTVCHRLIYWRGEVVAIRYPNHTYAWSGKIPCTGVRKCIYCGHIEGE